MLHRINIPPVTRALLSSIAVLSLLYGIARWREYGNSPYPDPIPYLALIPSQFLMYPWTLLCATFVEQNIFTVLINGAIMFYGGKYLERAWGSKEFAKFILITALASNVSGVFLYIIWSLLTGRSTASTSAFSGGTAIQAAFLVAFKQLVPEHTVTVAKGIVKMRVKHFPAIFLAVNALGAIFLWTHVAFNLSWLGFLAGWAYLRFYKRQPDLTGTSTSGAGIKGDPSDTFAFASFFPDAMQPAVSFVADKVFAALVAIRICTPFSAEDIATGNEQAIARGQAGLPNLLNNPHRGGFRISGKREEAERRRALALKALDQRLQAASANRSQQSAGSSAPSQLAQPSQPSSSGSPAASTVTPTIPPGQRMLGETTYNLDASSTS
ncbi:hypothetical protein VTO42DRAFT_7470 [Malbranchea cinnamomea]